jgi:hypothetical protein
MLAFLMTLVPEKILNFDYIIIIIIIIIIVVVQNGGCEFFSSPPRPDRCWGPPSLISNGYEGLFP